MSVKTTRFIRKPLYVDAVRVTAENFNDVAIWCDGTVVLDSDDAATRGPKYIRVRVHNPKTTRQTRAYVGDWILYTERGYKVYMVKAFSNSFDECDEDEQDPNQLSYEEVSTGVEIADINEATGVR